LEAKNGSSGVSEQEAFGWAVRVVRLGDWSAATPEQPRFQVAGRFLTIRDICERERNRDVPLPQAVADDLFALFHRASDADLHVDLKLSETYSTGAKCLLEFLGRREAEYRDHEA
jgi:hypothetical protein